MKKILSIILFSIVFSLTLSTIAFAKTNPQTKDNIITPKEVAECPIGGIHAAYCESTIYTVYVDDVRMRNNFSEFKCVKCGESIFCDGYPQTTGGYLNNYFQTYTSMNIVSGYGVIKTKSIYMGYKTTSGYPGWRFYR